MGGRLEQNLNHEGHREHEEDRRSRLGFYTLCGEGKASCSLATRELFACARRMLGANGYSPSQAGESWTRCRISFLRDLRVLRG